MWGMGGCLTRNIFSNWKKENKGGWGLSFIHWLPPRRKATPGGLLAHRGASEDELQLTGFLCEGINRVKNRAIVFWLLVIGVHLRFAGFFCLL